MRKRSVWIEVLAAAVIAGVAVALLIIVTTACAPLSTKPFEPTQQVSQKEIEYQMIKALLPEGMEEMRSGMDCVAYVEYQIAWCEATYTCSTREYRGYKRDLRRLKKVYDSQCLYSPEHIGEVFRAMRQRRGPLGRR